MKPAHKFTAPYEDQILLEIEQGNLDFRPGVHALMECGLTYFEACEAFEDAVDRGIAANSQFGVGA